MGKLAHLPQECLKLIFCRFVYLLQESHIEDHMKKITHLLNDKQN